ncbi:hypothetical protein [Streptomyces sp. NRRL F-5727]|uniref:hypothetical protein n=1 Tax=Streptomyces sp. NRRL F-5727 TaxID=1463871 RepID=UPI0004C7C5D8|nr:hypothetical protein [Streptomyces sp. NRRL F-5727]
MTTQSTATRLVDQAASDLEANRRLQQKLTERITVLQREEALLLDILSLAQQYEGFADPSRLPEQPQDEPGTAATKAKRASAGAEARRATPAKAAATGRPRKAGTKAKARQPLLGDLLMELLGAHEEPRLAQELRDELLAEHPDRNPTPQVVRNTLEALVAKGRVQRHKQQRSVMYTLVVPDSAH